MFLVAALFVTCESQSQEPARTAFDVPETDEGLPGTGPIRRYPWFRELWRNKRTGWAEQVEADQGAVVFLGDSITQGWGDRLGGSFDDLKVANRGISGDTTRGMLVRLQGDVLDLQPKGVVMLMGTNDLEEKATPASIAANVQLIVEGIEAHSPDIPIVLCLVFPSSASKSRSAKDIRDVNQRYRDAVAGKPGVTVLDTWTLFANAEGDAVEAQFPDLLHPNKSGYAMWAAALRPVLATGGFLDAAPDAFEVEEDFRSMSSGEGLPGWEEEGAGEAGTARQFVAVNGRIVALTPPDGAAPRTLRWKNPLLGDLLVRLEFRATPHAEGGIAIGDVVVPCGDFRLLPGLKEVEGYVPQGWNTLEVSVTRGMLRATCNGQVLPLEHRETDGGRLSLIGKRGQMEYRRLRLAL